MKDKKIAIIGLGLIGGSLARAFRERLGISNITVVTRDSNSVAQAVKDGVIARGFSSFNEYVFEADIIFICSPVKSAIGYFDQLCGKVKPDCIITDVGSTKAEIINHVNSIDNPPCFLGGHPMAGSEKTGYLASSSHLFENAYYIMTPSKSSTESSVNCLQALIKGIGAIPVNLDADTHDRITGSISHVPHVIASAIVNMVRETDTPDGKMQMLAAGGFKDITRIASSSPEMWENIILSNKGQIGGILDNFVELLSKFKAYIENEDSVSIYNFFESAKIYRDTFSSAKNGLISPLYEIIVDVMDKPGIIGQIATILGDNAVNIKNINVSNSREFEQGCLRITLSDLESVDRSFDLLVSKGYKVYRKC